MRVRPAAHAPRRRSTAPTTVRPPSRRVPAPRRPARRRAPQPPRPPAPAAASANAFTTAAATMRGSMCGPTASADVVTAAVGIFRRRPATPGRSASKSRSRAVVSARPPQPARRRPAATGQRQPRRRRPVQARVPRRPRRPARRRAPQPQPRVPRPCACWSVSITCGSNDRTTQITPAVPSTTATRARPASRPANRAWATSRPRAAAAHRPPARPPPPVKERIL